MKKIRVIIMTLVLSISMLAPEFSMLPAAYAEEAPTVDQAEESAGAAAGTEASDAGSAAEDGTASQNRDPGDAAGPGANTDSQDQSADIDSDVQPEETAPEPADPANETQEAEGEVTEEPSEPIEIGAYDKLDFATLYDANALVIPSELKDRITITHTKYREGILVQGTVEDLNALRIKINSEFDFDSGSAGRISFDGLKDKDRGMSVEALIYMNDGEDPLSAIGLKKQMGKKEWSNVGEQSVSLGSADISGKKSVSVGFRITGKDATKETSIALRSLQFCKTTVPVMYFHIDESEGTIEAMNDSGDHSVECYGSVDLIVPDEFNEDERFRDEYGTQKSIEDMQLEYIRGRGNSTWSADKKPYKVKFAKKQNLFGFGKNKHWVLLANRYDNSLIRNRMTYWLGQQMGMDYTPQCVPVEVVMNGEFYGSYLLCEQIRVGEGRVTIDDLDDIKDVPAVTDPLIETGGYLLSMDYEEDKDKAFQTERGMQLFIESPDDNVQYYSDYIKAYTQKVENAIFGDGFKDAEGKPYTDYLDLDAAVDYWWVQEFSENGDAYGSGSTYLYKKRDPEEGNNGKLYWGPLWDFDFVAWGDLDYESMPSESLDRTGTVWFDRMKADPVFINKVRERWYEKGGLRDKIEEITKEGGLLDKYKDQMKTSYDYDHALWGPNESEFMEYEPEIEQLRTWIIRRTEYVDEAVKDLKIEDHKVEFVVNGKVVKTVTTHGYLLGSDFPDEPAQKGMVFNGWVSDDYDFYEPGTRVTKDLVLTAEFIDESALVHAKNIFFRNYDVYYAAYIDGYSYDSEWYYPQYRVMPDGAFEGEIKWASSNTDVAEPSEEGGLKLKSYGDATITATLSNGVKNSFVIHVIQYKDLKDYEDLSISASKLSLKKGQYKQILVKMSPASCEQPEMIWLSSNDNVAQVDELGIVTAIKPGTADIMAVDMYTRQVLKCRVTVVSKTNLGKKVKRGGSTYKITSDKKGKKYCALIKAKNAKNVTIPAYIKYGKTKYYVTGIGAKAFSKSKARIVTVKTKKLTKAGCKNALRGSKVTRIWVKVGKRSVNLKLAKKYRKIFKRKNSGKYAVVRGR